MRPDLEIQNTLSDLRAFAPTEQEIAAAEARGRQQAIDELRAEAERLDEICPPETDLGFRGHREAANWLELAATAPDLWATVHVEHPDGTAEPAFGQMDEIDDEGLIARGRQQMIDALRDDERWNSWVLELPGEYAPCLMAADYLDSIAKEGSRKLLTDEEYERVERSAVASVRTGHTVGCLCNACERERGRPVTPEARVLLYRTDAGEGRRDGE